MSSSEHQIPDNSGVHTASHCIQCGKALTAEFSGPSCPACLLLGGSNDPEEEIEADFTVTLVKPERSKTASSPGQDRWNPPTPEQLSHLLPQYHIESLLGRGGMGAVYKGHQERLQRAVAIKLLPKELADDPNFVARFEREARTLAKLDHPGIISIYDFGQTTEGHLFFVMEFVDGTDLHKLISREGIDPPLALEIITQICDALQFAHSVGVVHRDIKPANILVTRDGRVKLADFGLARPYASDMGDRLTNSRVVMGTPEYMAPEQKQGQGDHRVDLYALGVMLYEMLCGKPPQGAWLPPSKRVSVDVRLDQVVIKAMQEEPELRYQQAMQVKTDLDVIRSSSNKENSISASTITPDQALSRERKSIRSKKSVWMTAGFAALLCVVVTGFWMAGDEKVGIKSTGSDEIIGQKGTGQEKFKPASSIQTGFSSNNEPSVTTITESEIVDSFEIRYRINKDSTAHVVGYVGLSDTLSIPAEINGRRVIGIANYAFQNNKQIKSAIIADGIETIGSFAFKGCSELTDVRLPSTLKVIGPWAFEFCKKLKQPVLPAGVTEIAEGAFAGGNILTFEPPPALRILDVYSYWNCNEIKQVKIPRSLETIVGGAFAGCSGIKEFQIEENHPTLAVVEGVIFDKSLKKIVHFPPGRNGTYIIPATTQTIGEKAFYGCFELQSVKLQEGLEEIGKWSFIQCNSLETIEIPMSVKKVMEGAFSDCKNLKSVKILSANTIVDPEQIEKLGEKLVFPNR